MQTAHVLATLACLAPLAQEDEPSFEQEVAALVERTNALESFRLVYDVVKTRADETKEGTLEILYLSPGFGRTRMSEPSGDMEYWMVGDDVYVKVSENGWKSARVHKPAVFSVLDEHFPLADDAPRGLFFSLDLDREDGDLGMLVQVGRGFSQREFLLTWLGELRSASDVVREEDAFVWSSDGVSKRVSRRTGLLEELELESGGKRLRIHLRSAELDVELPAELLEPPREVLGLPEDVEVARQLIIPADKIRQHAFERADQWLTRTKSAFDERARADWRAVLETHHRPILEVFHSRMDADVGAQLAKSAEELREERLRDPSPERLATLREELGKSRKGLEANLANNLEKKLEHLALPDSVSRDALLAVEQELFSALWDELMTAPLLARHDEELAAALER